MLDSEVCESCYIERIIILHPETDAVGQLSVDAVIARYPRTLEPEDRPKDWTIQLHDLGMQDTLFEDLQTVTSESFIAMKTTDIAMRVSQSSLHWTTNCTG